MSVEGEQRPFSRPVPCPGESCASPQWTDQPADNRQAPEPSAQPIAQPSSTSFHGPSGNFTQGEKRGKLQINDKTLKRQEKHFPFQMQEELQKNKKNKTS